MLVSIRPPQAMPSSAGMKDPSALSELNRLSRKRNQTHGGRAADGGEMRGKPLKAFQPRHRRCAVSFPVPSIIPVSSLHSPAPLCRHLPSTPFRGSSIVFLRGACCYWSLSGDVGRTSVDAIRGSVYVQALQEQLAGK